jgi:Zn finger protein HypA/HybF involved in hydrogenase expression
MAEDGTDINLTKWIRTDPKKNSNIITVNQYPVQWQCIECGFDTKSKSRPKICPGCNTVDSDLDFGVKLFARKAAIGWHD